MGINLWGAQLRRRGAVLAMWEPRATRPNQQPASRSLSPLWRLARLPNLKWGPRWRSPHCIKKYMCGWYLLFDNKTNEDRKLNSFCCLNFGKKIQIFLLLISQKIESNFRKILTQLKFMEKCLSRFGFSAQLPNHRCAFTGLKAFLQQSYSLLQTTGGSYHHWTQNQGR